MYKLYSMAGSCSLGVHVFLNELGQDFELVPHGDAEFKKMVPFGSVPVLQDGDIVLQEGASIMHYLAEKHASDLLPTSGAAKWKAFDWMMIANATVHGAYGKMFAAANMMEDGPEKTKYMEALAEKISATWAIIDAQLAKTQFVAGDTVTIADIWLSVYANWGGYFPVKITLGDNVERMIREVIARPAYQKALATEGVEYKAVA